MSEDVREVVDAAVEMVAHDRTQLPRLFASAGRRLGPVDPPADVWEWTAEDRFRVRLLHACGDPWAELEGLYRYGDTPERRAVLRALDVLPPADEGLARALVDDALRSNDPRLVTAALGPRGTALLDDDAFGQALLKVAFLGLDVRRVPGVGARMTTALVHRLMGLVLERVAAGRAAPQGIWEVTAGFTDDDAVRVLRHELASAVPARRDAARAALASQAALR